MARAVVVGRSSPRRSISRCANRSALHEVLGRTPRPVRCVTSLGSAGSSGHRAGRRPAGAAPTVVRFKLDVSRLDAGDRRRGGGRRVLATDRLQGPVPPRGRRPDGAAGDVRTHARGVPDVVPGGPARLPEQCASCSPITERVSDDAPIRASSTSARPLLAARAVVNVKPSPRSAACGAVGGLYAGCESRRASDVRRRYGELGVGRGQTRAAGIARFTPARPTTWRRRAYNLDGPAGRLPASPLAPRPEATGFRWAA